MSRKALYTQSYNEHAYQQIHNGYHQSGSVLPGLVQLWLPQTCAEGLRQLTGATDMAPSIQVFFLHVALLYCGMTTSMGGITDLQKASGGFYPPLAVGGYYPPICESICATLYYAHMYEYIITHS